MKQLKYVVLPIIAGILVITLSYALISYAQFSIQSQVMRLSTFKSWPSSIKTLPYSAILLLLSQLYQFSLVGAGILTGFLSKRKGLLHGAWVGIIVALVFQLGMLAYSALFKGAVFGNNAPESMISQYLTNGLLTILIRAPFIIFLTSVGGFIGEMIARRNKK